MGRGAGSVVRIVSVDDMAFSAVAARTSLPDAGVKQLLQPERMTYRERLLTTHHPP